MTSEAEISDTIRGADGPLRIVGGGTRGVADRVAGEVLSLAGLSGIDLYEPAALTMVARAGTPLAVIEAALAREGQRLAFEPPDLRAVLGTSGEPTIGGAFAANVSGSRRVVAGAARDFLLGVRVVDGMGNAFKNGGRVMKNVTGYDLVKLMSGAHGTLGVLTEVSFKVLPVSETQITLALPDVDASTAVAAMSAALGTPFEVSGAAYGAVGGSGSAAFLRIEGFEASVRYRADRLRARLASFGSIEEMAAEQSADLWRKIGALAPYVGVEGDLWRASVRPSDAAAVLAALPVEAMSLLDWGGGRIWALCPAGTDFRAAMRGIGGHATLVRGQVTDATGPVFPPEAAPIAALSAGLRARFDPRGILNPGLMS